MSMAMLFHLRSKLQVCVVHARVNSLLSFSCALTIDTRMHACIHAHTFPRTGDDVQFPSTGATVRAVPAKPRKAISRPGDTFWKGASGRKPARIGEDVHDEDDDVDAAVPPQRALAAPSDIKMHCRDGENTITVNVTWEMSWSDVLDMLRVTFGRAVVFQYSNKVKSGRTSDRNHYHENFIDVDCQFHLHHSAHEFCTHNNFSTCIPCSFCVHLSGNHLPVYSPESQVRKYMVHSAESSNTIYYDICIFISIFTSTC